MRSFLRERLKVESVRIPHGVVTPTLQDGVLTVVTRDQRRNLPIARLYCYELVDPLSSRIERESEWKASRLHRVTTFHLEQN